DVARGTRLVLDHDRLSEKLAEARRNDPRHEVRRAARCEGDDHPDRPVGIAGLRERCEAMTEKHQCDQCGTRQSHPPPPFSSTAPLAAFAAAFPRSLRLAAGLLS